MNINHNLHNNHSGEKNKCSLYPSFRFNEAVLALTFFPGLNVYNNLPASDIKFKEQLFSIYSLYLQNLLSTFHYVAINIRIEYLLC